MKAGRIVAWTVVIAIVSAGLGAALFFVPRWLAQTAEQPAPPEPTPPAVRHIKATLYYVSDDGLRLVPLERDVPFGEGVLDQARRIVEAQIQPVQPPLTSAVPAGTTLRAVYLSERGEAFVDLSPEIASAHPGGALNELLTVYTIVDALTTNLPAVTGVQILVDGKEVDTLAGHVDLRRPLTRSTLLIQGSPETPAPPQASQPGVPAPEPAAGTRNPGL
jgi:hypothetical protein